MNASVLDYLKLRVLSFYHEAVMLQNGQMPAPRMCILYPTYACNHRCIGCDYARLTARGKSFTASEFGHVIDELLSLGIKSVEFCGGGEPTQHPSLTDAIDRLIESGIAFGLLTNGTGLTPDLDRRLVFHGSYCRVSVEAASARVFNRYKRPVNGRDGFEEVLRNIETLVAARDAAGARTRLQISYKYSIDMNNFEDVADAVDVAYRLKVDSVQFKCVRNVPSEIRDAALIVRLTADLARKREMYPDLRILDNLQKSSLTRCGCWLSALQVTIDPFGDVYICCYYRHRMEKHRLGNLFAHSLRDIWYSDEHWRKMREIDTAECNKYDCRFHHYNELMHDLVVQDDAQLSFI
jgi:radical SAM protein with 4Fe4S-binding SPASM domain